MNNLDAQLIQVEHDIAELDELIEYVFVDDISLMEKRELLYERRGVLIEALTLQGVFDTSRDFG